MWDAFSNAFINLITQVIAIIEGFCGDWGLAIIILTIIVRILIMPLMNKSTRSTAKMQVLQPKMQEIQDRYADDPEAMQREMSKFYAENDFNPMGGCLPILLQVPIFFALFQAIRNVEEVSGGTASFYDIIPDLAKVPGGAVADLGWGPAVPYIVLVVLFAGTTLFNMLLSTRTQTDEQQRRTSLIMGVVMSAWMAWLGWMQLPAGVLLYYNVSALWQVAQQQLVTKHVLNAAKAEAEAQIADQPVQVNVVRRDHKKRPRKKS